MCVVIEEGVRNVATLFLVELSLRKQKALDLTVVVLARTWRCEKAFVISLLFHMQTRTCRYISLFQYLL